MATRLERARMNERAALLKELGVEDPEKAKAAIAAAKAAEDAKKTAEERAAELRAKYESATTEAQRKDELIKEHASRMLMALTPEQQKVITDFAGDNPAEQLRAIHHFAPTWAKSENAQPQASQTPPKQETPPAAPPAQTAPAPTAPAGTTPHSPPDPRATYMALRSKNPFAAAAYGLANRQAYDRRQ